MLEREIEKKVCDYAKKRGWFVRKLTSSSGRGIPDRLFIKKSYVVFIEFKSSVGKLTELQKITIEEMLLQEANVYVVNSIYTGYGIIEYYDKLIESKIEDDNK